MRRDFQELLHASFNFIISAVWFVGCTPYSNRIYLPFTYHRDCEFLSFIFCITNFTTLQSSKYTRGTFKFELSVYWFGVLCNSCLGTLLACRRSSSSSKQKPRVARFISNLQLISVLSPFFLLNTEQNIFVN